MQAIEFRNVRKEYQDGSQIIQALKPTNLVINKGEFVAIVGPSGSGKSTFLTLAGGLLTPSEGEILVNNQPFSQVAEKKRAQLRFKEIGFILQSSNLIPFLTIEDQMRLVDKITQAAQPVPMARGSRWRNPSKTVAQPDFPSSNLRSSFLHLFFHHCVDRFICELSVLVDFFLAESAGFI